MNVELQIKLNEASGVPFYRQIVDQISNGVRHGELVPGSTLPSVRDLAKQLLVSLITVRRAYSDLETLGLVVRKQGQGTFIAPSVRSASRDEARSEARRLIGEAITASRKLGLDGEELKKVIAALLKEGADDAN